jgi:hypothetical protein
LGFHEGEEFIEEKARVIGSEPVVFQGAVETI